MTKEKQAEQVDLTWALGNFFIHYANFRGRSSRSEYFWAFGFFFTLGLLFGLIVPTWPSAEIKFLLTALSSLIAIGTILPFLALTVRRLRDAGFSPYLAFLIVVPFGGLALLILAFFEPKISAASSSKADAETLVGLELEIRTLEDLHRQGLIDEKQLKEAKNKALGI